MGEVTSYLRSASNTSAKEEVGEGDRSRECGRENEETDNDKDNRGRKRREHPMKSME